MKENQNNQRRLQDIVSTEISLIKTSETIGGALNHLGTLIAKIRRQPHVDPIIASAEAELATEDRIAFENLERTVAWFHEKIKILLPHVPRNSNSFAMAEVSALLNFQSLSLQETGYVGSLLFEFRQLYLEVTREGKNRLLFEGWMKTEKGGSGLVEVFDWPDYVDKSLNTLPYEQQLYQWKERADTSLSCLLRFLKILSLYPTFVPITLSAHVIDERPKSLLELEERQCQAIIGYYLSFFRSPDVAKHPLSILELIKLVDRFLHMLEQKLELDPSNNAGSPAQVSVVINQFLFFMGSAKKEASQGGIEPVVPTKGAKGHWRTLHLEEDLEKLIPIGNEVWRATIQGGVDIAGVSREDVGKRIREVAEKRDVQLRDSRDNRFLRAAKKTDPRDWKNGKCVGLKS